MKLKIFTLLVIFGLSFQNAIAEDLGNLYDSAVQKIDKETDPWNPDYEFKPEVKIPEHEIESIKNNVTDNAATKTTKNAITSIAMGIGSTPLSKVAAVATGNNLEKLDGIWIARKKTIRRNFIPLGTLVPARTNNCNARLPYEEKDFEKKVVISQEDGAYVFKSHIPYTLHSYENKTVENGGEVNYANFGFKGVLDKENLTFMYVFKNQDYLEKPTVPKETYQRGKIFYQEISPLKIAGIGYETIESPECTGFIRDEIEFELVRADGDPGAGDGSGDKKDKSSLVQDESDGLGNKNDFNPASGELGSDYANGIPDDARFSRKIPTDTAVAGKPFLNDPNYNNMKTDSTGNTTAGMW